MESDVMTNKCINNMKRIITIILVSLMSLAASAQRYTVMNFDLDGIRPLTKLTETQIVQRFGKPVSVHIGKDPDDDSKYITRYTFENLIIRVDSKEGLCGFTVYSSDYPVATSMINIEGIRVGDSMDVMKKYPFTTPVKRPELKNMGYKKLDADTYTFSFPNDDDLQDIEVKDGKIVSISMDINVSGY